MYYICRIGRSKPFTLYLTNPHTPPPPPNMVYSAEHPYKGTVVATYFTTSYCGGKKENNGKNTMVNQIDLLW